MTRSTILPRSVLVLLIVMPLAVLLGILLANPDQMSSLLGVVVLFGVLTLPIVIRWHHALLVFSLNAALIIYFLPGAPSLWMLIALVSLFWSVLNRILNREIRYNNVPWVTWPLIIFAAVVLFTAELTGGIGVRALGSDVYGGKKYIYIIFSILAYFALSMPTIPVQKANFYAGAFFLATLTAAVANLLYYVPDLWFLYLFFPTEYALGLAVEDVSVMAVKFSRLGGVTAAAIALYSYMLMRYSIRGVFDLSHPWRVLVVLATLLASLLGGFRSSLVIMFMLFVFLFYLQQLHRTRIFPMVLLGGVLMMALLVPLASRLPLSVQRTLSVLPLEINPVARVDATESTEWRLRMWTALMPEIPRYLWLGKGYTSSAVDYYLSIESFKRGFSADYEASLIAGDYHNGPLSVIIPFGIWGVLAFVLFTYGALKTLIRNFKYGDPRLRNINSFLLSAFLTQLIFFLFIFGAIHSDILKFVGLVGLSVSLNGGVRNRTMASSGSPAVAVPEPEPEPAGSL